MRSSRLTGDEVETISSFMSHSRTLRHTRAPGPGDLRRAVDGSDT
jgi:hypothetical protein